MEKNNNDGGQTNLIDYQKVIGKLFFGEERSIACSFFSKKLILSYCLQPMVKNLNIFHIFELANNI